MLLLGSSKTGGDCTTCSTCSVKSRLYLKGEKTELTMAEKERLLECIKIHEVIFNPEHPSRSVRDLVTSAWEDVAEKTGFPGKLSTQPPPPPSNSFMETDLCRVGKISC